MFWAKIKERVPRSRALQPQTLTHPRRAYDIMKYFSVDLMKHLCERFRRRETSWYPGTGHYSLRRSRTDGVRTISHEVFLNRSHEGLILDF